MKPTIKDFIAKYGDLNLLEGNHYKGSLGLGNNQLTSVEFPEGMTIGGSLWLENNQLTSVEFPEGMTIGGSLGLENNQLTSKPDTSHINRTAPDVFHWEWRGRRYIKADGIFQQVIKQRGNVYFVRSIGSDKDQYLVTDGNGKWAHGDTVKKAKDDLIYKISNRDKSKYESWTTATKVSFEEAIEAYRVITGACAAGTKGFVERMTPGQRKDRYTVAEIIELTKGQYGHEAFKAFFGK